MRILLVDDHQIVRDGLRMCLSAAPDVQVVGEAGSGPEGIEACRQLQPDVAVVDISLPGMNGIDAARAMIRATDGCTRVVMLSIHDDREFVSESLRAGASGYLVKTCAFEELVQALRTVAAGEIYVSPSCNHGSPVNETAALAPDNAYHCLTPRQRQVLQLLADGMASKQIATHLNLSEKTVHTFRKQIMHRLGVPSVAGLTKYAVRHGLTTLQ